MNWRYGQRLIIHLADSPAHGHDYCGSQNHEEENSKLEPLIRRCAAQSIKIVGMPIHPSAQMSYDRCKLIYDSEHGHLYEIRPFRSSGVSNLFTNAIVEAVIAAAQRNKMKSPMILIA
jgi:hypothetical protein